MDEERFHWQRSAACQGIEPEVFFPISDDDAWRAKEICGACHVRNQCLAFSLRNRERYGVWGGVTEKERVEMFRRGVAQEALQEAVGRAVWPGFADNSSRRGDLNPRPAAYEAAALPLSYSGEARRF